MFKNYVKIAFRNTAKHRDYSAINIFGLAAGLKIGYRNLLRNKSFSIINISGLAVGLACFLLILTYLKGELSYDQYHENYNRIYRVLHDYGDADKSEKDFYTSPEEFQVYGNATVGPTLQNEFPEVRQFFRFANRFSFLLEVNNQTFREDQIIFADSSAFKIFSWKLKLGDPKTALKNPKSIVLTESLARKFFGKDNPLGQSIKILDYDYSYLVTGVMEDVPSNSHFTFTGLASMGDLEQRAPQAFNNWNHRRWYTYILLEQGVDMELLRQKIPQVIQKYHSNKNYGIDLEPLASVYLHSQADKQPEATGNLANIYLFAAIAIFILIIASVNFVNLSTARSLERAKEVAIRKTIGANRQSLIFQFLAESFLITFLSALLAVHLMILALPAMRMVSEKPFDLMAILSWQNSLVFLFLIFSIAVVVGTYPALVLSNFKPGKALKGKFGSSAHGTTVRRALVVFQFTLSITLIVGTVVVFQQLKHLQNQDLGFSKEQMVVIDFDWDRNVQQHIESIISEFENQSKVMSVSTSRSMPGEFIPHQDTQVELRNGMMTNKSIPLLDVDAGFIPNYELKIIAGRNFSNEMAQDLNQSLIVNRATTLSLGYSEVEEIIGKTFSQLGRTGRVIGVVEDFNFKSLHSNIGSLCMRIAPRTHLRKIAIRIAIGDIGNTLSDLEEIWNKFAPQRPFTYVFLDKVFEDHYRAENRFSKTFTIFTGIAIFIACLGLFGLISYNTKHRTKEIGVRKVLGASVANVVAMLSKDFVKLVVVANIVAWPIAYFAMNKWLENFAYRIEIGVWVFAFAGASALLIAAFTVSLQAVKAAVANPVDSLRYE